jgi:23S rRNA G2445 N2-methylase RlmL
VGKEPADYSEMMHQLKEIVETWQAVMLYSSAGFTAFTEIPDSKLRSVFIIVL